jgi:hypothetical protein
MDTDGWQRRWITHTTNYLITKVEGLDHDIRVNKISNLFPFELREFLRRSRLSAYSVLGMRKQFPAKRYYGNGETAKNIEQQRNGETARR